MMWANTRRGGLGTARGVSAWLSRAAAPTNEATAASAAKVICSSFMVQLVLNNDDRVWLTG